MFRNRSHWWRTTEPAADLSPVLSGDVSADVCVIGGGVAGVSAAYHLKSLDPGCDVVLLESEVCGFGASGRNAGQLIVHFGGGSLSGQLMRYGSTRVGEGWQYTAEGIELIEGFMTEGGFAADYLPTGTLQAGLKADNGKALDGFTKFLDAIGQLKHMSVLSAERVAEEVNNPQLVGGVLDRRGGQINPLKLVRGIKGMAETAGAQFYENSPVGWIDTSGDQIVVETGMGRVHCKKVILTTNAYTHLLRGVEKIGSRTIQNTLIVHGSITEPLTQKQWDAVRWQGRYGVNTVGDVFYSFAPTMDGRILYVGGYYVNLPKGDALAPELNMQFLKDGHQHFTEFFPVLSDVKTEHTWGGPISATFDLIPHVGLSKDPRIAYAVGCWGHGVPIGVRNGLTLAELILERQTASTEMWFVKRSGQGWPGRTLANIGTRRVFGMVRHSAKALGKKMDPPLKFGSSLARK